MRTRRHGTEFLGERIERFSDALGARAGEDRRFCTGAFGRFVAVQDEEQRWGRRGRERVAAFVARQRQRGLIT